MLPMDFGKSLFYQLFVFGKNNITLITIIEDMIFRLSVQLSFKAYCTICEL